MENFNPEVLLKEVEFRFTRSGGKGGQKINKTSNAVQLCYEPLKITVSCQKERQRSLNRFLALRELVDQIEMKISPHTSKRLKEFERIRKNKARLHSRAQEKTK
jgi:protein subunit release factor B